jgi:hypothetical protein
MSTKFDIIVVEERLKLFHQHQDGANSDDKKSDCIRGCSSTDVASGSMWMSQLASEDTLLIGVSSHLQRDEKRLKELGKAEIVWPKPLPRLDSSLLRQLLVALLLKRSKGAVAEAALGQTL